MDPLDLLHDAALPISSSRRLHEALTFGFARGESEERLVEVTAPALRASSFRAECFAQDLFLDELLAGCFPVEATGRRFEPSRGQLKKLLLAPPDRASVLLRQGILTELSESLPLRQALESAYQSLRALRIGLAGADAVGGRMSHLRRRIEILTLVRRAVIELCSLGQLAQSGLGRTRVWADSVRAGKAYQRLEHLLNFEDQRTVLESRLQLGYDGSLRRFEIIRVSETEHRAFPRGRAGRVIRWLLARIKGYRFSDEDLMSQLLDQVYGDLEPEVAELLGACLELEFYLVALGFAKFCRSAGHEVCLPEFGDADDDAAVGNADDSSRRILHGLFNPWLLAQGVKTIPFDDEQADARCTVILTGPNSGGKTRYLQALAICQLLGQVGLFVPASKARLLWVEQLFLSLLERTEANQEEGRLGMELLRIRHVFETSGQHSLIVMDELCSGTNPSEGEQIFDMVLRLLDELRPQVLISTHFLDFAERLAAQERPQLSFLQVALGPGEVPTYQFVPGVARTSLARNTAARLGVTQDELLKLVERHKKRKSPVPSS